MTKLTKSIFLKTSIVWLLIAGILLQNFVPVAAALLENENAGDVTVSLSSVLRDGNEVIDINVTPMTEGAVVTGILLPGSEAAVEGSTAQYTATSAEPINFTVNYELPVVETVEVQPAEGEEPLAEGEEPQTQEVTTMTPFTASFTYTPEKIGAVVPTFVATAIMDADEVVGTVIDVMVAAGENATITAVRLGETTVEAANASFEIATADEQASYDFEIAYTLNGEVAIAYFNYVPVVNMPEVNTPVVEPELQSAVEPTTPPVDDSTPDPVGQITDVDGLTPGTVSINKTAEWTNYDAKQADISFTLQGIPAVVGTDIVIVLDKSGSMDDVAGQWENATAAVNTLANNLLSSGSNNRVALVLFEGDEPGADLGATEGSVNFQTNLSDITNALNAAVLGTSGTNYTAGLSKAIVYANSRTEAQERPLEIIFISDGEPWAANGPMSVGDPNWNGTEQSAILEGMGADIHTVSIGRSVKALEQIRTTNGLHADAASASDLHEIFQNIESAISNTVIVDTISDYFVLDTANTKLTDNGNGTYTYEGQTFALSTDANGRQVVTFDVGYVSKTAQVFQIPVLAEFENGTYPTNETAVVTYTKSGENLTSNPPSPVLSRGQGSITIAYYEVNAAGQYITADGDATSNILFAKTPTTVAFTDPVHGTNLPVALNGTTYSVDTQGLPAGFTLHADETAPKDVTLTLSDLDQTVSFKVTQYYDTQAVSLHILLPNIVNGATDIVDLRNSNQYYNNLGAGQYLDTNDAFDPTTNMLVEDISGAAVEAYLTEQVFVDDTTEEADGADHIKNNADWNAYDVLVQMAEDGKYTELSGLVDINGDAVFTGETSTYLEQAKALEGNKKYDFEIVWIRIVKPGDDDITTADSYFRAVHIDGMIIDRGGEIPTPEVEVTFYDHNGIEVGSTTVPQGSTLDQIQAAANTAQTALNLDVDTQEFLGWSTVAGDVDDIVTIEGNTTTAILSAYDLYAIVKHQVDYNVSGIAAMTADNVDVNDIPATPVLTEKVLHNSLISQPVYTPTTLDGEANVYTFKGWYTTPDLQAGTEFDFTTDVISQPTTLYGAWEVSGPQAYNITYYVGDGTEAGSVDGTADGKFVTTGHVYGSTPDVEAFMFTAPEGKEFSHWIYVNTTDINQGGTLTFHNDGNDGYLGALAKFMPMTGDLEVIAVYKDKYYTVEYDVTGAPTLANDGVEAAQTPADETVKHGDKATDPQYGLNVLTGTSQNFTFNGWYTTPDFAIGTEFDFANDTIISGITLYGEWVPATNVYAVTYEFVGEPTVSALEGITAADLATEPAALSNIAHGSTLTKPTVTPNKVVGIYTTFTMSQDWYTIDSTGTAVPFVFGENGTEITGPTTIYIPWNDATTQYTVTYQAGTYGTGDDEVITVDAGATPLVLTLEQAGMAEEVGYDFTGWKVSETVSYNPGENLAPVTINVVLVAQYESNPAERLQITLTPYVGTYDADEHNAVTANVTDANGDPLPEGTVLNIEYRVNNGEWTTTLPQAKSVAYNANDIEARVTATGYVGATSTSVNTDIEPFPLNVVPNDHIDIIYGDNFDGTDLYTIDPVFAADTNTVTFDGAPTVNTNYDKTTVATRNVGDYNVWLTDNAEFTVNSVDYTLVISEEQTEFNVGKAVINVSPVVNPDSYIFNDAIPTSFANAVLNANEFKYPADTDPAKEDLTWLETLIGTDLFTTTAVTGSSVGDYDVVAKAGVVTDITNYTINYVDGNIEITQGYLHTDSALNANGFDMSKPYDTTALTFDPSLVAVIDGATNQRVDNSTLEFTYSTDNGLTFSDEIPSRVNAGTTNILIMVSDPTGNYEEWTIEQAVEASITVDPVTLTITAAPYAMEYGNTPVLSYLAPVGLQGQDTLENIGLDTQIQLSTLADENSLPATYDINITGPATAHMGNYNVNYVPNILEITNNTTLAIVATPYIGVYNAALNDALLAAVPSNPNATLSYSIDGGPFQATMPEIIDADSYTVTVRAEAEGYDSVETTVTPEVTPAPVTITAASFTKVTGTADPAFTATVAGLLGNDTIAYTVGRTNLSEVVADYPITITYTADPNYVVTLVNGILAITPVVVVVPPAPIVLPIPVPGVPDIQNVVIEDNIVPQGPAPEDDVIIEDEQVPTAAAPAWALLNLIMAITTALISIILLVGYFTKKKNSDEDDDSDEEIKRRGLARILSILPAIGGIVLFILTENMNNPMIIVDRWTWAMAVILIVEVIAALFSKKRREETTREA